MPILGIESLIYGVEDLEESTRFFDDFGLPAFEKTNKKTHYRLEEGSNVILMHLDDPDLIKGFEDKGVKEITWGVDSQASLDALATRLETHQEITRSDDGVIRTKAPSGMNIALRVWERKRSPMHRTL